MRVVISQNLTDIGQNADPTRPLLKHNSYSVTEHVGKIYTSDPGYEICAVFIVPET